jgi:hypothetical protein
LCFVKAFLKIFPQDIVFFADFRTQNGRKCRRFQSNLSHETKYATFLLFCKKAKKLQKLPLQNGKNVV